MKLEAPFGVFVTINELPGKLNRPDEPLFSWKPSLSWEQKERQDLSVILTELWIRGHKEEETLDLSDLIPGLPSDRFVVNTIKSYIPLDPSTHKVQNWNGVKELLKEAVDKQNSMAILNMDRASYVDSFLFLRSNKKNNWVLVLFQSKQKSTTKSRQEISTWLCIRVSESRKTR